MLVAGFGGQSSHALLSWYVAYRGSMSTLCMRSVTAASESRIEVHFEDLECGLCESRFKKRYESPGLILKV